MIWHVVPVVEEVVAKIIKHPLTILGFPLSPEVGPLFLGLYSVSPIRNRFTKIPLRNYGQRIQVLIFHDIRTLPDPSS